jgi:hypothetical protein
VEQVFLDCGRSNAQLMRDSLGRTVPRNTAWDSKHWMTKNSALALPVPLPLAKERAGSNGRPNQRLKLTPRRPVVLVFSVARRSLTAIR